MSNISAAQQAKINTFLTKLVNYPETGTTTRREALNIAFQRGGIVEQDTQPAVKWNRVKYNRMNWQEQIVYEKRTEERKPLYMLKFDPNNSSYYEITKSEYDYFLTLTK
jgi:hypothetical protein